MKSHGYFQPTPETQPLWDELAAAKATGDRNGIAKLTEQIRRLSIEAHYAGSRRTENSGGDSADTGANTGDED